MRIELMVPCSHKELWQALIQNAELTERGAWRDQGNGERHEHSNQDCPAHPGISGVVAVTIRNPRARPSPTEHAPFHPRSGGERHRSGVTVQQAGRG